LQWRLIAVRWLAVGCIDPNKEASPSDCGRPEAIVNWMAMKLCERPTNSWWPRESNGAYVQKPLLAPKPLRKLGTYPDLAALDIEMLRKNGIQAARTILKECPPSPTLTPRGLLLDGERKSIEPLAHSSANVA
jgi:CheY-like chemotaxis protein